MALGLIKLATVCNVQNDPFPQIPRVASHGVPRSVYHAHHDRLAAQTGEESSGSGLRKLGLFLRARAERGASRPGQAAAAAAAVATATREVRSTGGSKLAQQAHAQNLTRFQPRAQLKPQLTVSGEGGGHRRQDGCDPSREAARGGL